VQIEEMAFDRLRRSHGTRNVLSLRLPRAAVQTALIRHVQYHPVSGKILHVDFFRVSMDERLTMKIPLRFVGESPAVKNEGGVLLHLLESLEVECRASDIVEALEVDISPLAALDDVLHASDVKLPANYTLVTDAEEPIAKVAAPRIETPEVAAEAAEAPTEEASPASPAGSEE
jgi:large subunit ribosomal protein L25